jgi:hypothetical protein
MRSRVSEIATCGGVPSARNHTSNFVMLQPHSDIFELHPNTQGVNVP